MTLKLVGDGSASGFAVINAETGEAPENVEMVEFEKHENSAPVAMIRVTRIAVDLKAQVDRLTD